ncbi:hypothetical protein LFM09_01900 [Lentzea alba]|uniref:hypothetical protein n=1 Tax=Lentzea alba TaxID=2714351 RepID=UPI0039BF1541
MDQILPSAPPPPLPPPPVKRGTPFLHCAAGASIWYFALIAAYVAVGLKTGSGLGQLGAALLVGAVLYLPTTVIMWLCLLRARLQPWVLIFVSLPIYFVVWVLANGTMGALRVVFGALLS